MIKKIRKLKEKNLLRRNAHFLRFPTLTRPLLDAPIFTTSYHDKEIHLSEKLLERICKAFQKAERSCGETDIWTELTEANRAFITALASNDFTTLRRLFASLFHGPLVFGMAHTDLFLTPKSPYDPNYFSYRCRDLIHSLAEALALKRLQSNQQTSLASYVSSTNADPAHWIELIEQTLGHSIEMPNVGKAPIAHIGKYNISPDSVRHAYIAFRIKQLGINSTDGILEIGGGFGNVARYAYLQGFRHYTLVDLPYVNAIQAAFLAMTIGEENISLFDENAYAAISLHPSSKKELLTGPFKLALNMDSLPEINQDESKKYLELVVSTADLFLSVNQEAKKTHRSDILQYCVPELVEEVDGFTRVSRHPYWMEQGYAEELFSTPKR